MNENEYNVRQFRLMLEFIEAYEIGQSNLGNLVSNLDALQSALQAPSTSFREKFESLWGRLEDTYAFMLDEERNLPNEIDNKIIVEAISELKTLISPHL